MGAEAAVAKVWSTPVPAAFSTARHRVLMTTDTLSDVWPYAIELSRALIARGHAVALAAMGALPSREQQREVAAVPGLALHASAYKLAWMDDPWDDMRLASKWLMNLARELRPSVVHLNHFGHADLPWPAPVLSVAHSCVLAWWRAVHAAPPPPAWLRYRQCVAASLRASDLLIAPTYAMLHGLERHYGTHCAARVIAHGRSPVTEASAVKGPWIFSAASIDDAGRNGQSLANIAAQLSWPVYIGGDTPHHESAGGFDNVRVLGQLGNAQLRRWLAHTSIYAAPARYEPSGLAVFDAALARCALVLGDIDSLRELWDGVALFIAPDDTQALQRTLQRLIDDPELRERQAALALRRAQMYTPEAMADGYVHAYNDIAAPRTVGTTALAQPARAATLVQIAPMLGARQEDRHGYAAFPHVWNRQPDQHDDHVVAWPGRDRSHRGSRRPDT